MLWNFHVRLKYIKPRMQLSLQYYLSNIVFQNEKKVQETSFLTKTTLMGPIQGIIHYVPFHCLE